MSFSSPSETAVEAPAAKHGADHAASLRAIIRHVGDRPTAADFVDVVYSCEFSAAALADWIRPNGDADPFAQAANAHLTTVGPTGGDPFADFASLCAANLLGQAAGTTGRRLDLPAYVQHCHAVAVIARQIADQLGDPVLAARAFLAGWLHDIGKPALDGAFPKTYARVLADTYAGYECICDVEERLLGVDHAVAGQHIGQHWQLPAALVHCIRHHHQPQDTEAKPSHNVTLLNLVRTADDMARRLGLGFSGFNRSFRYDDLAVHGLPPDVLMSVERTIRSELVDNSTPPAAIEHLQQARHRGSHTGQVSGRRRLPRRTETLTALLEALAEGADATSMCQSAADCICELTGAARAAVFALMDDASHVTMAIRTDRRDRTIDIPLGSRSSIICDGLAAALADTADGFTRLPESLAILDDALTEVGWIDAARLRVVACDNRPVGGILIGTADPMSGTIARGVQRDKLDAVIHSVGLALGAQAARCKAQARCDEILAHQRRLHTAGSFDNGSRSVQSLAQMAAGAAHELNNPLAVIAGRAQLLRRECDNPDAEQTLETIAQQADKASRMVSDLLRCAKPESPAPKLIRLLDWAQRLQQRWQRRFDIDPAQIEIHIADAGTTLYVDEKQLTRAADEIAANARDAMDVKNARLQINSSSTPTDETVVVSIADNGCGMDSKTMEQAIVPFFSGRTAGRNPGLGLTRAYGLVEANGGWLRIESSPGFGTAVSMHLPARAPRVSQ